MPAATKASKAAKTTEEAKDIRKKILADPNTAGIAKNLGVPVDEYVDRVVHFVLNPDEDPEVYLVEDEDLESLGMPAPDEKVMLAFLREALGASEATEKTEFSEAPKRTMSLDGAARVTAVDADAKLGAELKKQMRGKRGGKG